MNRETYPASFSPLVGDVSAGAGATSIAVTGIQTYPVSPTTPLDQQVLKFTADITQPHGGSWGPATLATSGMVNVNGTVVSGDPEVFINNLDSIDGMVLPITVNSKATSVANHAILLNLFPLSDDYIVTVNGPTQVTVNGALNAFKSGTDYLFLINAVLATAFTKNLGYAVNGVAGV